MSQKATRKSQNATIVIEDKEKTDSPVKEMKKKIAANAEKEKQAADKTDKPAEKNDKPEPADKNKSTEKADKTTAKSDKHEKSDKNAEKSDKHEKSDKSAEKPEKAADKKSEKADSKAGEKKSDKPVEKKPDQAEKKEESKADKSKEKPAKALNGTHNGGAAANGDDANVTVSDSSDVELVIEEDEVFPELTYDDSDTDAFEADAASRSLTRRSQVKATKTPETPRPLSDKESEESKESKLLKLKEDAAAAVVTSDRKLRSADSPKPESKKDKKDSPKKQEQSNQEEEKKAPSKKDLEETEKEDPKDGKKAEKVDKLNLDVVIELENVEESVPARTRARVSPYTRTRHDVTHTSAMADYTGNNSTMEMDITESSSLAEDPSLNESGYLRGLRGIRGRHSYKVLREVKLTNPNASRPRPPPVLPTALSRPLGAVVGRKRKPSDADTERDEPVPSPVPEPARDALEEEEEEERRHGKRMKLLDRLSLPFRRSGLTHRAADIVGINTDLPLSAPVAAVPGFDPETMKTPSVPLPAANPRDSNRCCIM